MDTGKTPNITLEMDGEILISRKPKVDRILHQIVA
jgi:hypothetical protein